MPVMNYRKGTEKEKSWKISQDNDLNEENKSRSEQSRIPDGFENF